MANQKFDAEYDVVVIGGGGSGKSAALTAKQGGLNVALLEKMEQTGGSSIYVEGTCAFESSEQKARQKPNNPAGHFPTREEGFRRYIDYSHHRANPDVVRMQVDNAAESIDIFKSMGVVFTDVNIYAYDQPYELYTFHRPDGLGAKFQEVLLRACVNAGVDIFTSTPAKKIIMEDGKVVGVKALDADGNVMTIGCKALILASGGFGNNPELVHKYSWLYRTAYDMWPAVPVHNTGDGLKMAVEAGADTENLGAILCMPCARGKTFSSHVSGAGSQPVLWVNTKAERYCNEEVAMNFADAANTILKQPGGISYPIMDADTIKHLVEDGSDIGLGDFIEYHLKLTRLPSELEQDIADGIAWKGNTPEELAKAIGIDPQKLAATIAEYNKACDAGYDPMFYKPKKYLRPIRKPPFYAINMASSMLCSSGGIRVNGNLQVTDKDYKPIPGLYAVGNDASGLYGDAYILDVPGTASAFAHASGRVAARHILKTLKG